MPTDITSRDQVSALLDRVWGRAEASDDEIAAAAEVLSAAKLEVEARLSLLADQSQTALAASPFDDEAQQMLGQVTRRLTDRGS